MQVPAGETLSLSGNQPILLVRGAEVMTVPVGETLSLSGNAPILTPDANTIRMFRERLTAAGAIDTVFADFDRQLKERGYLPMGGQIVDATLVAAPKQRNTEAEKAAVKDGKSAVEIWPDEPAKARQKDTDARWTLKFAKARPTADGRPQPDIAIPSFGYQNHVSIDRAHGQ